MPGATVCNVDFAGGDLASSPLSYSLTRSAAE